MFLIIDGWLNFRQEFELIEPQVLNIAAQGLSYGVHVVVVRQPVGGDPPGAQGPARHPVRAAPR